MKRIKLDYIVSRPVGEAGRKAARAVALLRGGEREPAIRLYDEARAATSLHATTWSNLAVFELLRGDLVAATAHATRALDQSPGCADARVNLALALLGQERTAETVDALRRAVEIAPNHAVALANYGVILLATGEHALAETQLGAAAEANPRSWRLPYERARAARANGDSAATRAHLLVALDRAVAALPTSLTAAPRRPAHTVSGLGDALCEAGDLLRSAGQEFHLLAGTLLALVRDGELLGHDKDIDLALPWDADRDALAELFGGSPAFTAPAPPLRPELHWSFSVTHAATGVGIDLFFLKHEADGVLSGGIVFSERIFSRIRPFGLGELQWRGRSWAIPSPPEQYFEDIYGPDWRNPDPYFDTMLSNPSRTADSIPVAVRLGLLRLCDSLQAGHWLRAHALCRQLLAREQIPQVVAMEAALRQRCRQIGP